MVSDEVQARLEHDQQVEQTMYRVGRTRQLRLVSETGGRAWRGREERGLLSNLPWPFRLWSGSYIVVDYARLRSDRSHSPTATCTLECTAATRMRADRPCGAEHGLPALYVAGRGALLQPA